MKRALWIASLCFLSSSVAFANETDPYYAWVNPPRDGTDAINRAINTRFLQGLRDVDADASCRDAAAAMVFPLSSTAMFFPFSDMGSWGFDYAPRTASEYSDRFRRTSAYRHINSMINVLPLDPTARVGEILIGTDKLAHFFTNGLRHYDHYLEKREEGASVDDALRATVDFGIKEEKTWLGMWPSGILSYADLHANFAGVQFLRSLCEGPAEQRGLHVVDGRWALAKPFDIRNHVTPCWDEGFYPNAFGRDGEAAVRGMRERCSDLAATRASDRRAQYETQQCAVLVKERVAAGIKSGELPDPKAWSYAGFCPEEQRRELAKRNEMMNERDKSASSSRGAFTGGTGGVGR